MERENKLNKGIKTMYDLEETIEIVMDSDCNDLTVGDCFDEEEVINTGETWIWEDGVEPYNSPSAISEDICGGCFKEVRENKMTKFEEKKYRVTVTTTHKRVYYLDAGDWETAQDMVEEPYAYGLVENALDYFKPDAESESGEEFEVEEV